MAVRTDKQYVFFFGAGVKNTEGDASMKALLGVRGANLAEMAGVGLPVPPGFTISTEACAFFNKHGNQYPPGLTEQIKAQLKKLEDRMEKKFGDAQNPLLVSVRSGAAVPVPGLMDAVLNLGLTDKTLPGFIRQAGNERTGWDCYRRFIATFGEVVMGPASGLTHRDFENAMLEIKRKYNAKQDTDLTASQLKELTENFKKIYFQKVRKSFPQDPFEQLRLAIHAAFQSWASSAAEEFRRSNKVAGLLGTAVNVCTMVIGNIGDESGVGVAFTRDGLTGSSKPRGEYLVNAQGEDLFAGVRTAKDLHEMPRELSPLWAKVYGSLLEILDKLERYYKYPQSVEFAVEQGHLWILQTFDATHTGLAGVRWMVEMATGRDVFTGEPQAKLLTPKEALLSLAPTDLEQMLLPVFDMAAERKATVLARGTPSAPGAASGRMVFDTKEAEKAATADKQDRMILVRPEIQPSDTDGVWAVQGILTGSRTFAAQAAAVARGWGKACITGAGDAKIDPAKKTLTINGTVLKEGDWISLNGSTGAIYAGQIHVETSPAIVAVMQGNKAATKHPVYQMYKQVLEWADKFRHIRVRANADTVRDVALAKEFGAEGIGLCRTEHLFTEAEHVSALHEYLAAASADVRARALKKILLLQRADFEALFKTINGNPIGIRLIDPRMVHFILHDHGKTVHLGSQHYSALCDAQVRAAMEAACNLEKKGNRPNPEFLVPLVAVKAELDCYLEIVRGAADSVIRERKSRVKYSVGTMMEIPRAALTADALAESSELFNFSISDLTQRIFGYNGSDNGLCLPACQNERVIPFDPRQTLDVVGIGQLMETAVKRGRETRPDLRCGLSGEHGGDPASIRFACKIGMNFTSCSPYRIPIARLAAAQAAIKQ